MNSPSSSFSKVNAPQSWKTWRERNWIRIGVLSQLTQGLLSDKVFGLGPHISPIIFSMLEKFIIKQHFPLFSGNAVGRNDLFVPGHKFPTEFFVSGNFVFPLLNSSVFFQFGKLNRVLGRSTWLKHEWTFDLSQTPAV